MSPLYFSTKDRTAIIVAPLKTSHAWRVLKCRSEQLLEVSEGLFVLHDIVWNVSSKRIP